MKIKVGERHAYSGLQVVLQFIQTIRNEASDCFNIKELSGLLDKSQQHR